MSVQVHDVMKMGEIVVYNCYMNNILNPETFQVA